MKLTAKSGATLAAAAGALLLSNVFVAPVAVAAEADIKCVGVNACKGNSSCKSATNSCKGLNSCKGQGFVALTEAQCTQVGGKVAS